MYILADECVDAGIVKRLEDQGHKVIDIKKESPGIDDADVREKANREGVLLLSEDKGFGKRVFQNEEQLPHGFVLYRLHGFTEDQKANRISEFIEKYKEALIGKFAVVEHATDRIRSMPTQYPEQTR